MIRYRISARDSEGQHTTCKAAFGAHAVLYGLDECWRLTCRSRRSRFIEWRLGFRQRCAERLSDVSSFAVPHVMHVQNRRRLFHEVIVYSRDFESSGSQLPHNRIHFILQEDEVTHHRGITITPGESGPRTQC